VSACAAVHESNPQSMPSVTHKHFARALWMKVSSMDDAPSSDANRLDNSRIRWLRRRPSVVAPKLTAQIGMEILATSPEAFVAFRNARKGGIAQGAGETLPLSRREVSAASRGPPSAMTSRLPSLRAVAIFVAAGRALSFTAAAKTVNLTPSAVSRRIGDLERELGTVLFRRFNRRLELTPAGARYLETVGPAIDLIEHASAAKPAERARQGHGYQSR
jgi:Bacterial regulatory helix-turn-helix protein, lysR family